MLDAVNGNHPRPTTDDPRSVKIVVADASAQERSALRLLFEQQRPAPEIVEPTSFSGLTAELGRGCADVLVADAQFPGLTFAEPRRLCPSIVIVVLSSRPEDRARALAAGADAFVCRGDAPDVFLTAVLGLRSTVCSPGSDR
jgi:DNA-binding NarL/FixJ family response regulator